MNKTMTKTFMMFIWLLAPGMQSFGQQDPVTSQYLNNYFILNPAYAGMSKDLSLSAGYRLQWAGLGGSPVTMNANGHISLAANKMGVGLNIINDAIGSFKTTEIDASYAYHIPMSKGVELSFGLQAGAINYQADYSNLNIDRNDSKFSNVSEFLPNFGAGVLVRSEKYLVSLSVPHMLKPQGTPESLAVSSYAQNFYAFAAYVITASYRVKLKPSILLRSTPGVAPSLDYYFGFRTDDSYTLGAFTRDFKTAGFNGQINVGDALRFGYTFEIPTSTKSSLNFSTHEFMVTFRMAPLSFQNITDVRNF